MANIPFGLQCPLLFNFNPDVQVPALVFLSLRTQKTQTQSLTRLQFIICRLALLKMEIEVKRNTEIFKFHFNFLKFPIRIQVFIIFIVGMRVENLYQLKNIQFT